MTERILVINPNSNRGVTATLDRIVDPLRLWPTGRRSRARRWGEPLGIETQRHVDEVITPLCELIKREDNTSSTFIIACFGDPGLGSARETTAKPVFGICQAGVATAINHGERVGILINNRGRRELRPAPDAHAQPE